MLTILNPTGTNLVSASTFNVSSMTQLPLSYSKQGGKWIYCNHPETYTSADLADGNNGHLFNVVDVSGNKPHQIFFSYIAGEGMTNYFSAQIINTGSSAISVTVNNYGIRHTADSSLSDPLWSSASGESWKDFFGINSGSHTGTYQIAAGGSVKIINDVVKPYAAGLITGNVRFTLSSSSASAKVLFYAAASPNVSGLKSTGAVKSYISNSTSESYYSGYSNGYMLNATLTLKASELATNKCIYLNHRSGCNNMRIDNTVVNTDVLPITLVGNSGTVTAANNLANWCTQYVFTLKLQNDTSSSKTFTGYLRCPTSGSSNDYPVIMSGTNLKYAKLNSQAWKWLSVQVPANTTITESFQYILGTNSCESKEMIFKAT